MDPLGALLPGTEEALEPIIRRLTHLPEGVRRAMPTGTRRIGTPDLRLGREAFLPRLRSLRRTSAQSATESYHPGRSRTLKHCASPTSRLAFNLTVVTEVHDMAAVSLGARPCRRRPGGPACTPTRQLRRTASTTQSALSASRSSRLAWRWRGSSASAGFTEAASRRGS
jgi:hypothetical protein